jgi:hypothetical protein
MLSSNPEIVPINKQSIHVVLNLILGCRHLFTDQQGRRLIEPSGSPSCGTGLTQQFGKYSGKVLLTDESSCTG